MKSTPKCLTAPNRILQFAFGASEADWTAAKSYGPDVLPCVANPSAKAHPSSQIKQFAKIPSWYASKDSTGALLAAGVAGWTQRQSKPVEIEAWGEQPDYGICIQTRRVRAFDLDVENAAVAAHVAAGLLRRATAPRWPVRWRANSSRMLLPFRLPADESGDFEKRVIRLPDGGAVEFLAAGQMFVAAGTHPSGVRINWTYGVPDGLGLDGDVVPLPRLDELPELTRAEFEALATWLRETFGTESKEAATVSPGGRAAARTEMAGDPVVIALREAGLVRGTRPDGGVNVWCPWREDHSGDSGPSESSYWPAHTGGFAHGGFKCQHAHCAQRTVRDLRAFLELGANGERRDGRAEVDGFDGFGDEWRYVDPVVIDEIETARPDMLFLPGDGLPASLAARRIFEILGGERELFRRGTAAVELTPDNGLASVSPSAFRSRLSRKGRLVRAFVKPKNGKVFAGTKQCSEDCARLLLNTRETEYLPPIALVTEMPGLVEEGGTLRTTVQGYNAIGGGVLVRGSLAVETMPAQRAAALLADLLCDFDFTTDGDRTRALASLIAPAVRMGNLLPGTNALVTALEADDSQAGKGYYLELIHAIYGETPYTVRPRVGGVGSTDESLSQGLLSGRPFIGLDNLRGRINSTFLESTLTARNNPVQARVPGRGEVSVCVDRTLFQLTSNGIEATEDLANRLLLIRLRKQPESYDFKKFPEGDVLKHVPAHRGRYLGAVFSIVRHWHAAGKPQSDVKHTFREWCGVLDWIARDVFKTGPLLDGHAAAVKRVGNPALGWLRQVGEAVVEAGREGDTFSAGELMAFAAEAGIAPPWNATGPGGDVLAVRRLGMTLGPFFEKANCLEVDRVEVSRTFRRDKDFSNDTARAVKVYTFRRITPGVS